MFYLSDVIKIILSILPRWGFFPKGVDCYNPKYQLYPGKGEDQLLGGRAALPVEFNLQITTTKSFRVAFKVRLWTEGPREVPWEAAAVGTVLQPVRRGHFPQKLRCVYWTLSALKWGKENTSFCRDAAAEKSPWSLFLLFLPFRSGFTRCKIQLSAVYTEGECQFSC